jgi:methylated-DNA-[protein]-cysteine S-methyltransferase
MKSHAPFCRAVWKACAEIPKGQVRTYGWIARRIGKPKAARAVGQALGRNPFAPTVPCHRIVGADGRLTGFSAPGGVAAKRRLLEKEGNKMTPSLVYIVGRGSRRGCPQEP